MGDGACSGGKEVAAWLTIKKVLAALFSSGCRSGPSLKTVSFKSHLDL